MPWPRCHELEMLIVGLPVISCYVVYCVVSVNMSVNIKLEVKPIQNVVATIYGQKDSGLSPSNSLLYLLYLWLKSVSCVESDQGGCHTAGVVFCWWDSIKEDESIDKSFLKIIIQN